MATSRGAEPNALGFEPSEPQVLFLALVCFLRYPKGSDLGSHRGRRQRLGLGGRSGDRDGRDLWRLRARDGLSAHVGSSERDEDWRRERRRVYAAFYRSAREMEDLFERRRPTPAAEAARRSLPPQPWSPMPSAQDVHLDTMEMLGTPTIYLDAEEKAAADARRAARGASQDWTFQYFGALAGELERRRRAMLLDLGELDLLGGGEEVVSCAKEISRLVDEAMKPPSAKDETSSVPLDTLKEQFSSACQLFLRLAREDLEPSR